MLSGKPDGYSWTRLLFLALSSAVMITCLFRAARKTKYWYRCWESFETGFKKSGLSNLRKRKTGIRCVCTSGGHFSGQDPIQIWEYDACEIYWNF